MISDSIIYLLFSWGNAVIRVFTRIAEIMNTKLMNLFPQGSIFDTFVNGMFTPNGIRHYTLIEFLLGPAIFVVFMIRLLTLVKDSVSVNTDLW